MKVAEILQNRKIGQRLYDKLRRIEVRLDKVSTTDDETVIWCKHDSTHFAYSENGTWLPQGILRDRAAPNALRRIERNAQHEKSP